MNRTRLLQAVERLAVERGFHFLTLRRQEIPTLVRAYPAALLYPLSLRSVEGRKSGRASYDIELTLLRTVGRTAGPGARAEVAAQLEEQLLDLFTALSDEECVLAVEELQIRPESAPLTVHGEIALTAQAQIVTWF